MGIDSTLPINVKDINALKMLRNTPLDSCTQQQRLFFPIVMDSIVKDYGKLMDGDDTDLPELLAWTLRKRLYQQALTIIEALIPEDMVRRGIYYYARTPEDRKNMLETFNVRYWNTPVVSRYRFDSPDHFFIKILGREFVNPQQPKDKRTKEYTRLRIDALHVGTESLPQAFSNLGNDDLLYELLLSYYKIGELRNRVAHASSDVERPASADLMQADGNIADVKSAVTSFLDMYRSVCRRVARNTDAPQPLTIRADELRAYASAHRLLPLKSDGYDNVLEQNITISYSGKDLNITVRMMDTSAEEYME